MCFSDFGFQEHRPLFQTFAMVKRSPAEIFCFCKEGCQTKQQKILKLAACRNFPKQKREQKKWNMTNLRFIHAFLPTLRSPPGRKAEESPASISQTKQFKAEQCGFQAQQFRGWPLWHRSPCGIGESHLLYGLSV